MHGEDLVIVAVNPERFPVNSVVFDLSDQNIVDNSTCTRPPQKTSQLLSCSTAFVVECGLHLARGGGLLPLPGGQQGVRDADGHADNTRVQVDVPRGSCVCGRLPPARGQPLRLQRLRQRVTVVFYEPGYNSSCCCPKPIQAWWRHGGDGAPFSVPPTAWPQKHRQFVGSVLKTR